MRFHIEDRLAWIEKFMEVDVDDMMSQKHVKVHASLVKRADGGAIPADLGGDFLEKYLRSKLIIHAGLESEEGPAISAHLSAHRMKYYTETDGGALSIVAKSVRDQTCSHFVCFIAVHTLLTRRGADGNIGHGGMLVIRLFKEARAAGFVDAMTTARTLFKWKPHLCIIKDSGIFSYLLSTLLAWLVKSLSPCQ